MKRSLMVTLPTGLTVERRGHGGHIPEDMDSNGHSRTRRQTKCPTCGLWALWIPRVSALAAETPQPDPMQEMYDEQDAAAIEEDRRFEQYRDDEIAARHTGEA